MARKRVDLKAILADEDLRRDLMVSTIRATQAREGIETTEEQADRAYYVVTESDQATFIDVQRFRKGKHTDSESREEMFVRALVAPRSLRFDVARRDFGMISASPLAYRRVGLVGHVFRESPTLDPQLGTVKQGLATSDDRQWVRHRWEVSPALFGAGQKWVPFAKGGKFCRFYSDIELALSWEDDGRALKDYTAQKWGSVTKRIYSQEWYFKPGLSWALAGGAFSVRWMPAGGIFGHKGPALFVDDPQDEAFCCALLNSHLAEYLLLGLTSRQGMGGRWEVGLVKRLPIPQPSLEQRARLGYLAEEIHRAKISWDKGNEISTQFRRPWALRGDRGEGLSALFQALTDREAHEDARVQQLYAELNDEVYKLYAIPDATRAIIEETLGERPPELIWPQMENKTTAQKRMEHVWRLLSYVVKRVIEDDEDGIVPFIAAGGETALIDRVRTELAAQFPDQDINEVEVDIVNELKTKVKGYRRVQSIREWLEDVFFEYHVSLYKKRPIFWHIASSQGRGACAFGALVHYHKFDRDRLAKLRASYLRDAIAHFRREAGLAAQEERTEDRQEWQARLEDAQALDQRLQWVQEGAKGDPAPGDCRIRTPWKSEDELPVGWQPDLDDGVAVNISPLQTAGVLRVAKVI